MLQSFGERIRGGWFAGALIAVIAVAFVGWGLQYYIESNQAAAATVATVNGAPITETQFSNQVQLAQRQQEKSQGHALNDSDMLMLKKMMINQMIGRLVLTQALHHMGFAVNQNSLQASIEQMPQFQQNGAFSPELFQTILYQMGYQSPDDFFSFASDSVLIQQLLSGLRDTTFLLPYELKTAYRLWNQTRDVSFTLLPIAALAQKVTVSDSDIAQYYQLNKAQFATPEKVQLSYILLSPATLGQQVSVSDADVAAYYNSNTANFMMPATWAIARVTVPTQKAADALLAQVHAGKSLINFHPVLQTINAADASPGLLALLTSLHVHQISSPLPTPQGITLVEVMSMTPSHAKTFAEVKTQIKNSLVSQKMDQLLASKSEQLSNLTYTNPTTLAVAAKQLGIAVQTSPWVTKDAPASLGLFSEPDVIAAAFSSDVLSNGNNSNPISLKDGSVIVIRLAAHVAATEKPLADVKSDIIAALKTQIALRQAGLQAYNLETQLTKGEQANVKWQTRSNVTHTDTTLNKTLLQAIFTTPLNQIKAVQLSDGYALVKVTAIHNADWATATLAQKNGLQVSLERLRGQNEFQTYVQALMKTAKVVINDKTLAGSWQ